jgi:anaerobic magnesium-protoporphyrin IX monomethyl ester cyclase
MVLGVGRKGSIVRIQFIYPNRNAEEGFNHGIAALSGCLKARGHQTGLINLNEALGPVPTDAQVVERVRRFGADLVAFSVMTQQYKYALRLARAIRAALPQLPLAVGGVHATLCTQEVKAEGLWDFIGVGECDEALPDLVDRLARGDPSYVDVPNFCTRRPDGRYKDNPLGRYPLLEALPEKDYEVFELDTMLARKNGWQSILTSRGCPYRCSYCFNRQVSDRYWLEGGHARKAYLRRYPIETIIGQIRQLKARHPEIRTIIFDDDLFTLDERYCVDFVRRYVEAGIDLPFVLNAHVQSFSEPIARALAAAPCKIVKFGVESGSEPLRRHVLDRHMSNAQIASAFQLCHDHGLHTSAFLMFGMPYETADMMGQTIELIARIRPGRMRWAVFFPFPGTKSYTICQLGNLIDYRRMRSLDNYFVASSLRFDPATDLRIRKLQRTFHWRVNVRVNWPAAAEYRQLVEGVDAMDAEQWARQADTILPMDRQVSERLAAEGKRHYSIRYTEVMAVDSQYLLTEAGQDKHKPARTWRA